MGSSFFRSQLSSQPTLAGEVPPVGDRLGMDLEPWLSDSSPDWQLP